MILDVEIRLRVLIVFESAAHLDSYVESPVQLRSELASLKTKVAIDPLTGLGSSVFLKETVQDQVQRGGSDAAPLVVLTLDLAGFRDYNETEGREAGDTVLKQAAGVLRRSIREGLDTAFRTSADNFLVLLPNLSFKQAIETARNIRGTMQRSELPVTPVMGIVQHKISWDADQLVRLADNTRRIARKAGGGRIARIHPESGEIELLQL